MIVSSKDNRLRSLLLALEKKLFHGFEAAERLHVMNGCSRDRPIGEQLRYRLTRHNYEMARTEARLIDLDEPRTVTMVGCGVFPSTLIFLAENTAIPSLVGIDQDIEVVEHARSLIARTGHRISFECCPGDQFDFSRSDLIYIANGTNGKSRVLAHAAAVCPGGAQIVVRIPFGPGRLFYEALDPDLPPALTRSRLGKPDYVFLNRTVVFSRGTAQEARACREKRPSIAS